MIGGRKFLNEFTMEGVEVMRCDKFQRWTGGVVNKVRIIGRKKKRRIVKVWKIMYYDRLINIRIPIIDRWGRLYIHCLLSPNVTSCCININDLFPNRFSVCHS